MVWYDSKMSKYMVFIDGAFIRGEEPQDARPEPKENIIIFYNRRESDKIIHAVTSKYERVKKMVI